MCDECKHRDAMHCDERMNVETQCIASLRITNIAMRGDEYRDAMRCDECRDAKHCVSTIIR